MLLSIPIPPADFLSPADFLALLAAPGNFALTRVYLSQPHLRLRVENELSSSHAHVKQINPYLAMIYHDRVQTVFQLDISVDGSRTAVDGFKIELALAPGAFGAILLNPVFVLIADIEGIDPSSMRGALRFSQWLGPRWIWAANLAYERQPRTRARDYLFYSGLRKEQALGGLDTGAELKSTISSDGTHSAPDRELLIGPSVVWRLDPARSIEINTMFGLTANSPWAETNLSITLTEF
mgnify:CR=1 FL=1